jgi:lysophospholipase L1-like esterase
MKILSVLLIIFLLSVFARAQKSPVTVFLAGDSTMAEKLAEKRPETGWGERLQQYFDARKVKIENHAQNGRSTKTFISENRWQAIVDKLKKGDYVFIQFGHNDQSKEKGERYTPPEDFKANLRRMVADARAKGANPVLFTPVMRRRFDREGKFYDTHGEYPDLTRAVAKELNVALIDMHRASEKLLVEYGAEKSKKLFLILAPGESANYPKGLDDNTHFSPLGAEEMARLAVEEIKKARSIKLRKYLKK